MHLNRRMRLIWHKLWLIPLVGATADVVASEAAKLGGATVPMPWLFSAIGVAGMLGAAVARAYSVPLIPEGLETPDEALTRRSRVLGERLGATPVRVFVSDLPKLRGKVDTFLDGHDLFASKRVAALPEAERDFVLARALVVRGPVGRLHEWTTTYATAYGSLAVIALAVDLALSFERRSGPRMTIFFVFALTGSAVAPLLRSMWEKKLGIRSEESEQELALRVTNDLSGAQRALLGVADTAAEKKAAALESDKLEKWWNTAGQKIVEASEWYRRERSLAAKVE